MPHEYLRDVPMAEGEWVDRHLLVLAEYGALLGKRGYEVRPADDDHPLAWSRVLRDGREVRPEETEPLFAKAEQHLTKCPAPSRLINGRPYLRLKDYTKWRGRWVKGSLKATITEGLGRESFNDWVRAQGSEGVAELAGVRVGEITDYAADCPVHVTSDEEEARIRLQVRENVLGGLRDWSLSDPDAADWLWTRTGSFDRQPFRERLAAWCGLAEQLLGELGEFCSACRLIEGRYFAGYPVLYAEVAEMLENLREAAASLVDTRWRETTLADVTELRARELADLESMERDCALQFAQTRDPAG